MGVGCDLFWKCWYVEDSPTSNVKRFPKDMEYYGLACFWGVLRNDENDKASFLLGVLICIHILRVVVVSFPGDQFLRDRYDAWCLPPFL